MENIGNKLREVRECLKLSRQDVEEETARIARLRGNPNCKISANWLYRVERGDHSIGGAKLLTLALVYQLNVEELLAFNDVPSLQVEAEWHIPAEPKRTILLTPGPLNDVARLRFSDEYSPPPRKTSLLENESTPHASRYVRAIIGTEDNRMFPLLRAGAILLVDRHRRAVGKRVNARNEFELPIYLFETHDGLICGWSSLGKKDILSVLAHPCSGKSPFYFQYRQQIDVIGQIVGQHMWTVPPTQEEE